MLKRLEMQNICSHRSTVIEFGEGKNVFIGPTGSGKTSILTAIEFAFLGPKIPGWHLGELITDGATQGDVILDFTDPLTYQTYRITRTISRSSSSPTSGSQKECEILNLDTGDRSEGDKAVGETLTQLGFDPTVFSNVIHMRQGEFTRIIRESQEQKEVLDKLFKVARLENAYGELGKRSAPTQTLEAKLGELRAEAQLLKQEADKLESEKTLLERLMEDRQRKEANLQEAITQFGELSTLTKRITPEHEALIDARDRITKEEARRDNLLSALSNLQTELPSAVRIEPTDDSVELARKITSRLQSEVEAREGTSEAIESAEQIVESLTAKQKEMFAAMRVVESERDELIKQSSEISLYLEGKRGEPTVRCDRCGSILTVSQWGVHLTELRTRIEEAEKRLSPMGVDLGRVQSQLSKKKQELSELRKEERVLETMRNLSKQSSRLLEDIINSYKSLVESMSARNKHIRELAQILKIDESAPKVEQLVLESVTKVQNQAQIFGRDIPRLKGELSNFEELQIKPQHERVRTAREAADEYGKLQPIISDVEQRIHLLEDIRSTLREVQPIVREQFVETVSELAKNYFGGIYTGDDIKNIRLTADYDIIADRAGHPRHAMNLSGGQKVAVSIAFLLTLSELLSTTGFVVLDEPTTHLDETRREDLVRILSTLRNIPQLIIVDHHPELKTAADFRFNVSLEADGSSIVEPETS